MIFSYYINHHELAFILSYPFPLTGYDIVDVITNGYKWFFPEITKKY